MALTFAVMLTTLPPETTPFSSVRSSVIAGGAFLGWSARGGSSPQAGSVASSRAMAASVGRIRILYHGQARGGARV